MWRCVCVLGWVCVFKRRTSPQSYQLRFFSMFQSVRTPHGRIRLTLKYRKEHLMQLLMEPPTEKDEWHREKRACAESEQASSSDAQQQFPACLQACAELCFKFQRISVRHTNIPAVLCLHLQLHICSAARCSRLRYGGLQESKQGYSPAVNSRRTYAGCSVELFWLLIKFKMLILLAEWEHFGWSSLHQRAAWGLRLVLQKANVQKQQNKKMKFDFKK